MKLRCKNKGQNINVEGQNINVEGQNINAGGQNINAEGQNINAGGQNINAGGQNINAEFQCSKCHKVLQSRKRLNTHENKCDGVHVLQCHLCLKMFTTPQGKWQHNKRVACSAPVEATTTTMVHNNHHMRDQYNGPVIIDNSVHHHNNNNLTIHLNIHGKENYDALLDTIRTKYPQAFVSMVEYGDVASLLKLLHFNADFPENQTIRKPVKKDVSAEVHVGEGRWERRPAQHVIDTFRDETSKHICRSMSVPQRSTTLCVSESQSDHYLKEVLYEQSKSLDVSKDTKALLTPFKRNERERDEHVLRTEIQRIRKELMDEYPTLVDNPIFDKELKRLIRDRVESFEAKWGGG